jgi:post-segregation antitoxin (ccd killing protein)
MLFLNKVMVKRTCQVTLDIDLWMKAKRMGLNISECCERGLALMGERKNEAPEDRVARARQLLRPAEVDQLRQFRKVVSTGKLLQAKGDEFYSNGVRDVATADRWERVQVVDFDKIRRRIKALIGISLTEHDVEALFKLS